MNEITYIGNAKTPSSTANDRRCADRLFRMKYEKHVQHSALQITDTDTFYIDEPEKRSRVDTGNRQREHQRAHLPGADYVFRGHFVINVVVITRLPRSRSERCTSTDGVRSNRCRRSITIDTIRGGTFEYVIENRARQARKCRRTDEFPRNNS